MYQRFITVFAAMLALVAPAFAAVSAPHTADLGFMRADPSGWTHARISQELPNGCEYTADIHGTIRDDPAVVRDARYHAHLTVSPAVHCPYIAAARGPSRTVDIVSRDPARLERALSDHARVNGNPAMGRTCFYRPNIRVNSGHLVASGVAYACSYPHTVRGVSQR